MPSDAPGSAAGSASCPIRTAPCCRIRWALPMLHWLSLDPKLEGLIVPSKFYGIAAAGKPIVVIGDPERRTGAAVQAARLRSRRRAGDAETLVDALQRWSKAPATIAEMGARARAMLDANHSRRQGFARWEELLNRLADAERAKLSFDSPSFPPVGIGAGSSKAHSTGPFACTRVATTSGEGAVERQRAIIHPTDFSDESMTAFAHALKSA